MFHYRKTLHRYRNLRKKDFGICSFCNDKTKQKIKHQTKHAYVVPNRVFYDVWELRGVTDHLLVVPKRHVKSLADLTPAERSDIMELLAKYETKHYNIYARAAHSKQKSVAHQHTHLIKTEGKQAHGAFNILKPYIYIKF